ncbi:MAG TPA: hypothetical protein VN717_08990 [Gemmatimonadaceae bacterium]|nr:hypothetical protein [Gemmatimonadaceae bacterium]
MKLVLAAICLCFGVLPLAAQVGSEPEKSPYQDFTFHQDLEVFGGYFGGNSGEANVGPLSSSLAGVRYGLHVGGPAELSVRLTRASSTRNVLNPLLIGSARNLGTESDALWIGDVAINLALTGQKSWHHLIPVFGFGGGFVKSSAAPDIGAYSFGTSFAIQFGGGIKFVTHGPFGARLDVSDYLWQLSYPGGYYVAPTGVTAVLLQSQAQNQWTHNAIITLGITYIFAR